jgi:hypothetical protein
MILPFSTNLNGKPTYFVEKIHSGLLQHNLMGDFELKEDYNFDLEKLVTGQPKLHSIREDKNNRWKAGTKIDFFINVRQKSMFKFAPVLPVVSIQEFSIGYNNNGKAVIFIDGKIFCIQDFSIDHQYKLKQFAQKDGFDTTEDFLAYFNKDFKGKIIHWTDLRY